MDHKPEDQPEMERIVKAGGKVTADGRVNGGLNLSRALGDHAYKQNTTLPAHEQMISALPDVRHIAIEPERDEFMILACDGIWNFMSSQEVVRFIRPRLANIKDGNISKICEEVSYHTNRNIIESRTSEKFIFFTALRSLSRPGHPR